jgi:excinuclease UvrABC nuclease subunit
VTRNSLSLIPVTISTLSASFDAGMACVHVLFIRQGKVLGSRSYFPKVPAVPSWVKWWKPLSASSICRAARCARCRARSCSI